MKRDERRLTMTLRFSLSGLLLSRPNPILCVSFRLLPRIPGHFASRLYD